MTSYLKTPRIFGFHGVYKRLAIHLGLLDVHLGVGPNAERLVDAWARGQGFSGLPDAKPILLRWRSAVQKCLNERPPRTRPGWGNEAWAELAQRFAPSISEARERRYLHDLLHAVDDRSLGALRSIWQLQDEFDDEDFREETLHDRLRQREPAYGQLLEAIRAYEAFARKLQDAFDILKAAAAVVDSRGFVVPEIAEDDCFESSVAGLHESFDAAQHNLSEVTAGNLSLQNLFGTRFANFAEPMCGRVCALALCNHHEAVQRAKSAEGKRPWFDRIGPDRIYVRHQYREPRPELRPNAYVHDYRGRPIRRFYQDLTRS